MIKGREDRGKQPEKLLGGLTKWLSVGRVTDAFTVTRDRDMWKVMIAKLRGHVI